MQIWEVTKYTNSMSFGNCLGLNPADIYYLWDLEQVI